MMNSARGSDSLATRGPRQRPPPGSAAAGGSGASSAPVGRPGGLGVPVKLTKKSLEAFKKLQMAEQRLEDRSAAYEWVRAGTPEPLPTARNGSKGSNVNNNNGNNNRESGAPRTGSAPVAGGGGGDAASSVGGWTSSTARGARRRGPAAAVAASSAAGSAAPAVRLASALDGATVEACLEYLTRPHISWRSAQRFCEARWERITEQRRASRARSLNSSFASLADLETGSVASSACTAPAGFPLRAANRSKTHVGALRKGRLADPTTPSPRPAAAETALVVGAASPADLVPPSSSSAAAGAGAGGARAVSRGSVASRGSAATAPVAPRRALSKPGRLMDSNSNSNGAAASLGIGLSSAISVGGGGGGKATSNNNAIGGSASGASGAPAKRAPSVRSDRKASSVASSVAAPPSLASASSKLQKQKQQGAMQKKQHQQHKQPPSGGLQLTLTATKL